MENNSNIKSNICPMRGMANFCNSKCAWYEKNSKKCAILVIAMEIQHKFLNY